VSLKWECKIGLLTSIHKKEPKSACDGYGVLMFLPVAHVNIVRRRPLQKMGWRKSSEVSENEEAAQMPSLACNKQ
jgi:hypothetical protein